MKVTQKVINIANQIAKNTERQRKLNAQLNVELEKMGVDYRTDDFALIFSYLENDCDAKLFFKYLESGLDAQSFIDKFKFENGEYKKDF